MYFHAVHGKNIALSNDSSQAKRVSGFCQAITFSNNPLTQLQRVTFLVGSDFTGSGTTGSKYQHQHHHHHHHHHNGGNNLIKIATKPNWNGCLRIGLTTKNPITLTTSDLPEFSHPTLLNTEGYWITVLKPSFLKHGNKLSLVLDKDNSLQLAINYVVKATLFGNNMIPSANPALKLWLLLDLYGATNVVQFLPSDETPYEIKARGLDAVNNFHSACMSGGSKTIYKTRLLIVGQEGIGKSTLRNSMVNFKSERNREMIRHRKFDAFASFRISVNSSKKIWNLKAYKDDLNDDRKKQQHQQQHSKRQKSLTSSANTFRSMNNIYLSTTAANAAAASDESNNNNTNAISKRRSSSTSYLSEEAATDSSMMNNQHADDYLLSASNSSSSESDGDSLADNDEMTNLYSIDENEDETMMMMSDCDPEDLKKDPTGYYYKRVSMNIFQEILSTKLAEKIWPSNNNTLTLAVAATNLSSSETTTTIISDNSGLFEKLALVEFENSIYNQLKSSKILFKYYQQIIAKQMKSISAFRQSTIVVQSPTINNNNDNKTAAAAATAAPLNKRLSITMLDFAGQSFYYTTHQIFLSSRAIYLICFDLSKDLNELAHSNFEYASFEKNMELTNLDYLDFWMRSIHSHTAQVPPDSFTAAVAMSSSSTSAINNAAAATANNSSTDAIITIEYDEKTTLNFKYAALSPSIIIVGTNKNLIKSDTNKDEYIRKTFERIKEFVSTKIYAKHIVEPYFAIDSLASSSSSSASTENIVSEEKNAEEAENKEKEDPNNDAIVNGGVGSMGSGNGDNKDIELLKRVIEMVAINEPYMGEQLPLKWMNFEKSLEKLKSKGLFYASLSQICEIAHEKDIKTQEELTTCLNFFHDLGVIIYYGNANDIFLRNTIILKPQKLVEIFKMVLNAKRPESVRKFLADLSSSSNISNNSSNSRGAADQYEEDPLTGRLVLKRNAPSNSSSTNTNNNNNNSNHHHNNNNNQLTKLADMWQRYDLYGILDDNLLDILWSSVLDQKPGLLGLMKKFDLICEINVIGANNGNKSNMAYAFNNGESNLNREYLVPSRVTINYDDVIDDETTTTSNVNHHHHHNHVNNKKYSKNNHNHNHTYNSSSDDDEDEEDDDDIEDLTNYNNNNQNNQNNDNNSKKNSKRFQANISIVEFYYDFCGFLPESLFHRILTRTARWTLLKPGADWRTAVRLFYRKARFYLDENHDFILEMAPLKLARIKVQIVRVSNNNQQQQNQQPVIYPPEPNSCAKVRNFMETTLIELRNLWMKRLLFNACVQCACDKLCDLHQVAMCTHNNCLHFLNLDECLTNNVVTCDFRRVKTFIYKSWFPVQNISLHKGPVLAAVKSFSDNNMFYDETSLPSWVKNVAKLLQVNNNNNKENNINSNSKEAPSVIVTTVANENDWLALARLLGYTKSKINYFMESDNPALQLICDWIMSSDNTNLTIEFLLNYLEQIKRDDVIKIINNEREKETVNSSVFISYQWDSQDEVVKIREHLEKAGFNCFMDIGQIGGGNLLYQKIDQAIRNAKVIIACITPKFVVSHLCNREMALADLLRKPIVPIMLASTPWPPPGTMSLIFSQLVYIDMNGVGGHGGCGIHSDREQRFNEIVAMVSRHVNPSSYFLMNIDRSKDQQQNHNDGNHTGKTKRKLLDSLRRPSQLIRSSAQYYNQHNQSDAFLDNLNMYERQRNNSNNNNNNNNNRYPPYNNNNNNPNNHSFNHLLMQPNNNANSSNRTNNNNNAGRNRNNNQNDQSQNSDVPKCIICCLL